MIFALFLVSALGLAACAPSADKSAEEWLQAARDQKAAGDLRAASSSYKNALQKVPNNADARFQLGLIYNDIGEGAAAEKELEQARTLGQDSISLIVPVAQAILLQGRFKDLIDKVPVPTDGSALLIADVYALRGEAYLGLGMQRDAETAFQAALAKVPDHVRAYIGLARVALSQGDVQQANVQAAKAQKLDPKNHEVIFLLGQVAFAAKDPEAAIKYFKEAAIIAPEKWQYVLFQSYAQLSAGKIDDSIVSADKVLRLDSRQPEASYIRGLAAFHKKQYAAAKEYAERSLSRNQDSLPVLLLAGRSAALNGNLELANNYLERYLAQVPGDMSVRKTLGWVQMRLHRTGDALRTMEGGKDELDPEMLNMMGMAAIGSGNVTLAQDYLKKAQIQAGDAASAEVIARLGEAYLMSGNVQQGLNELEKAAAKEPKNPGLQTAYLWSCIRDGQFDRAIKGAKVVEANLYDSPIGYVVESVALTGKGDQPGAEKAMTQALALAPNNPLVVRGLATLVSSRDPNAGVKMLDAALAKMPKNMELLLGKAQILGRQGKPQEALAVLQQAKDIDPKAPMPRTLLAQNLLLSGKPAEALKLVSEVYEANKANADLIYVKGLAELAAGQVGNSVASLKRVVELRPNTADPAYQLAMAYERSGDVTNMGAQMQQALKLAPDNPEYQFAYARYQAYSGHTQDAKTAIANLRKRYPGDPRLLSLEGSIAVTMGDIPAAQAAYEKAFQVEPNSRNLITVQRIRMNQKQVDPALADLRKWLQAHPKDLPVQLFLADSLLQLGRAKDSVAEYQKVVAMLPEEYAFWNNYANAQLLAGDPAGALKSVDTAMQRGRNDASVQDTRGAILLQMKRPKDALENFRRATELAPDKPVYQYHLAQALAQADQKEEAMRVLDKISDRRDFPDHDKAASLLSQLQK